MNKPWPMMPLGEVLSKSNEWINLKADATYREVTVKLWGKGVVLRREVAGAEIAASRRILVRTNQLILSRIDARNGAAGIIPSELEGAVVSNDFPVFNLNTDRVEPRYFGWLIKNHDFVALCKAASEGTTNRVRLQEERFLSTQIPLPPLSEQKRVVARLEELATKIEEARGIRQQSLKEAEALFSSALSFAFANPLKQEKESIEDTKFLLKRMSETYVDTKSIKNNNAHPNCCNIYESGLFKLPTHWAWTDFGSILTHIVDCINDTPDFCDEPTGLIGLKTTNVRPYKLDLSQKWHMTADDFALWNRRGALQAGDIILTREAPMGYACILPTGITACLTQRLMLLRCDKNFIDSKYVLHYINSSHFQNQVLDMCRGLTTPHIRVQDTPLFKIPVAPLSEQRRIVAYLDDLQAKVDVLRRFQAETSTELNAMLPSVLDKAFKGKLV
ncbi:MAG: restriction endonuclease subunit S [Deltaproteobacteria bacterium]|nr:restriction endonuclease subunit S [Deltaproteobacteria bacterium]